MFICTPQTQVFLERYATYIIIKLELKLVYIRGSTAQRSLVQSRESEDHNTHHPYSLESAIHDNGPVVMSGATNSQCACVSVCVCVCVCVCV